jgi:hypothetical protein
MNDAVCMREAQCTRDRHANRDDFLEGQLLRTIQPVAERAAVHERQNEERPAEVIAGGEHWNDVRVRQLRRTSNFRQETIDAHRSQRVLAQDLDRDARSADAIAGAINHRCAPTTQLSLEGVAFRDFARQLGRRFRPDLPAVASPNM